MHSDDNKLAKTRAKHCVTHHFACDCRELRYDLMVQALRDIVKHQDIAAGQMAVLSSTRKIAADAIFEVTGEKV